MSPAVYVQTNDATGNEVIAFSRTGNGALDRGLKVRSMVLPDRFIDQDSPAAMYAAAGLDARGIVAKVFEALGKDVRIDLVHQAGQHAREPPVARGFRAHNSIRGLEPRRERSSIMKVILAQPRGFC